jgi:branched-chain amino acid transport system substrate-binding protein
MDFRLKVLAGALAFAAMAASHAADPIKIGVAGPYTGGSSSLGVSLREGVRLAIE